MLKEGILAGDCIYVSTAHSEELIDQYILKLDKILNEINYIIEDESFFKTYGIREAFKGFQRLN